MEKIKDNIHVETDFLGCNPSVVVTSGGVVMIDTPQKPLEAFKWKEQIHQHGDVTYIVNTDHHADHASGNYFFSGDTIMHEGTMKKLLTEGNVEAFKNHVKLIEPQSESLMDHYFIRKPTFTYTNKMNVCLGKEVLELIHVSGHTRDETIVYMPVKKVLFSGDNVCTNGIPTLRESYPKEWLEALDFMEGLDFEVLVPGHGKIGDRDSIGQFRRELTLLLNRVEELIVRGFTRDDIVEEVRYEDTVHREYPPSMSEFFSRSMKMSIGRLYDQLIKKWWWIGNDQGLDSKSGRLLPALLKNLAGMDLKVGLSRSEGDYVNI